MTESVAFEVYVGAQMENDADLADIVRLYAPDSEIATADVRPKGAMVLHCVLESDSAGPAVVLTNTADSYAGYSVSKLGATHPMGPVGPYDGPGGQHGPLRWLNYTNQVVSDGRHARTDLEAYKEGWPMRIQRSAQFISASTFMLSTRVANTSGIEFNYSLGEHVYFDMAVQPQSATELRVNGMTLDDKRVGGSGSFEAVMEGRALYWRGFDGQASITFPDDKEVRISAGQNVQDSSKDTDMLIWHRPKTNTICFEPVRGCVPSEDGRIADNQRLRIAAGQSTRLLTVVELL